MPNCVVATTHFTRIIIITTTYTQYKRGSSESTRPARTRLVCAQHTGYMEPPPREKRARAAFFREKEARREAKKQRKKARLLDKIAHGVAACDVAPPPAQASYISGK